MSENVSQPQGAKHNETWVPLRLLNDAPRDHRFDMTTDDLPSTIVHTIDRMAVDIFDQRGGNVIIIGSERSGKTFLVEQLIGNQEKYSGTPHYFVEVREVDLSGILGLTDTYTTYAALVAEELEIDPTQIIFVTGNNMVASTFTASGTGRKMIFEAQIGAYQKIMSDDSTYENGNWSKWNAFDANDILLTQDDLINMLHIMQTKTNENASTKKQVESFVKKIIGRRPSLLRNDGTVNAPPGLFAVILRRAAGLMKSTNSKEYKTVKGNPSWSRITHGVVEEFLDHFDPFTEEGTRGSTLGDQVNELLNDLLGGGLPGDGAPAQIILSRGPLDPESAPQTETETAPTGRETMPWTDLTTLSDRMKEQIYGQDESIDQVCQDIMVAAAGLTDERKPLASFLLMGQTGVGKTMIAETLAAELIEGGMNVLRLDMSEYSEKHEVSKLFGSPSGYVGYDEGGILTNAIKQNPRTLILLDETEKAHQSIWNSFLQVLDAGRMTTATGEVVDFSQTVLIMTSNLGTKNLSRGTSGFSIGSSTHTVNYEDQKKVMMTAAREYFRPEMLNRIDNILTVNPLLREIAEKIVVEEIGKVFDRAKLKTPQVSNDVVNSILQQSNFEEYGARDVQRTVRREVSVRLSQALFAKPKKGKAKNHVFTVVLGDSGDIELK